MGGGGGVIKYYNYYHSLFINKQAMLLPRTCEFSTSLVSDRDWNWIDNIVGPMPLDSN